MDSGAGNIPRRVWSMMSYNSSCSSFSSQSCSTGFAGQWNAHLLLKTSLRFFRLALSGRILDLSQAADLFSFSFIKSRKQTLLVWRQLCLLLDLGRVFTLNTNWKHWGLFLVDLLILHVVSALLFIVGHQWNTYLVLVLVKCEINSFLFLIRFFINDFVIILICWAQDPLTLIHCHVMWCYFLAGLQTAATEIVACCAAEIKHVIKSDTSYIANIYSYIIGIFC